MTQDNPLSPDAPRDLQIERAIAVDGPKLHDSFLIGDRVRLRDDPRFEGVITGISFNHAIMGYIVTLDDPVQLEGYAVPASTIVMMGGTMELVP